MNSDSYHEIGAGHLFCQDYSLHGSIGDVHYVIGCDGCSSSPKTEFGARLQAHIVRKLLEIHGGFVEPEVLKQGVLQDIRELKTKLRLSSENFDATLFVLTATGDEYRIVGWGDGVIVRRAKDGHFNATRVEFTTNAPRYLSYATDPARYERYLATFGTGKVLELTYEPGLDGEPERVEKELGGYFYEEEGLFTDDVSSISIASDGLDTFKERNGEDYLPILDFADKFTAHKNTNGAFVERLMKKLSTEHQKRDIIHVDDLFFGTIVFP